MGLGGGPCIQTEVNSAHPRVISNKPAKFEINLMNGSRAMRGTDRQVFLAFKERCHFEK